MIQNHWNIVNTGRKARIHVGQVNFKNKRKKWSPINCKINNVGGVLQVDQAPFEFNAPKYSDGEITLITKNRYDIVLKEEIAVPDNDRFELYIKPTGVNKVEGVVADINGDGRLDAIKYPGAYDHGDLYLYIHHGREATIKFLSTVNAKPASAVGTTVIEFEITNSGLLELTKGKRPNGVSRGDFATAQAAILNTPAPLSDEDGFSFREDQSADNIGFVIRKATAKTSKINFITGQPIEIPVTMTIRKKPASSGVFIIKKVIQNSDLYALEDSYYQDGCVLIDPVFTFYPEADPATVACDSRIFYEVGGGTDWATLVLGSIGSSISNSASSMESGFRSGAGSAWIRLGRGYLNYDISEIPMPSKIISATFSGYGILNGDPDINTPATLLTLATPTDPANLVLADYGEVENIDLTERLPHSSFSVSAYNVYTFIEAGIAKLKLGGVQSFAFRSEYDVDNIVPPNGGTSDYTQQIISASDTAGTSQDPILEVTTAAKSNRFEDGNALLDSKGLRIGATGRDIIL